VTTAPQISFCKSSNARWEVEVLTNSTFPSITSLNVSFNYYSKFSFFSFIAFSSLVMKFGRSAGSTLSLNPPVNKL